MNGEAFTPDATKLNLIIPDTRINPIEQCLTCGKCVSACSWFGQEGAPNPRRFVRLAALGLADALAADETIWNCMCCDRCSVDCPMEIKIMELPRLARRLPEGVKGLPSVFKMGIPNRFKHGNVNGITKEDWTDTLEWLSEELQEEVGKEDAIIPIDVKGAKYTYVPNPREINLIAMHLVAMCKLLYATGEGFTMLSDVYDVTNWPFLVGEDEKGKELTEKLIEAVESYEIDTLVLSECGHGYYALMKYIKDNNLKHNFRIVSIPELVYEKWQAGVLKLKENAFEEYVTYHDPCKIGRGLGIYDPAREILNHVTKGVVELHSNRERGMCCGGGGGILQDKDAKLKRMKTGKHKAMQMKDAATKRVSTVCLSCHMQLGDLSKHYELGMEVNTVCELAERSLILEDEG